MRLIISTILLITLISCKEEVKEIPFSSQTTAISTLFNKNQFDLAIKQELLEETGICSNAVIDSTQAITPCSPRFFELYKYAENIALKNGFILQVKANVNGFPARRMLIFTREKGKLITMNQIVGYLVEKRTTASGFDDLVIALVDNVGGYYDRYDVLIKYKDGKYQYAEALGDLQGKFDNPVLKKKQLNKLEKE